MARTVSLAVVSDGPRVNLIDCLGREHTSCPFRSIVHPYDASPEHGLVQDEHSGSRYIPASLEPVLVRRTLKLSSISRLPSVYLQRLIGGFSVPGRW